MSNKLSKNVGRAKQRRRSHGGPKFIQLFRYVLDSPAYISLSAFARSALIEVNHAHNGSNNGRIILSVRKVAERMGCANNTAMRALQELVDKGFIEPRIKGAFSVKFRLATEW
jgi:DNA-binding IclR family transcriptional regulator